MTFMAHRPQKDHHYPWISTTLTHISTRHALNSTYPTQLPPIHRIPPFITCWETLELETLQSKFLGSQTKFLSLKREPQPNNSTQASTQLVRAELDSTRTESTRMLSDTQAPLSSTEKGLVALREDYASRKPKLLSTNWGFPPPKQTNHSLPYKPNWNKKPSSLIPQKPDCQTPNSNSVLRTPIQKFWLRGKRCWWVSWRKPRKHARSRTSWWRICSTSRTKWKRNLLVCAKFVGTESVDDQGSWRRTCLDSIRVVGGSIEVLVAIRGAASIKSL